MASIFVNDLLKNRSKYRMKKSDFINSGSGAQCIREIDVAKTNPKRAHGYAQDLMTRYRLSVVG